MATKWTWTADTKRVDEFFEITFILRESGFGWLYVSLCNEWGREHFNRRWVAQVGDRELGTFADFAGDTFDEVFDQALLALKEREQELNEEIDKED